MGGDLDPTNDMRPAEAKWLEVRDRMTSMCCLAVKLGYRNDGEKWCVRHGGLGDDPNAYVVVYWPDIDRGAYDRYSFKEHSALGNCEVRTRFEATRYVQAHFDELEPGQVVDVEFILGETRKPKVPDRFYAMGAKNDD